MSEIATTEQVSEVIDRVKTWPKTLRIALAKRLLDTLDSPEASTATRGRHVEELIGLGAGPAPPPDDAVVRSWIDEHRMGKYG